MEIVVVLALFLLLFLPRLLSYAQKRVRQDAVKDSPTPGRAAALARVRQVKHFYIHVGFYVPTMIAVLLLSQLVGNEPVALAAAIVWTLAVAIHAFVVFVIHGRFTREWEERRVQSLIERED